MGAASYVVPNFLGGEISQFAQGRFDKPDYRVSLNVCLNAFPAEIGPWVRRPGATFAGTTRAGAKGRVIKFDFEQSTPYTLEFTDGFLRFRAGAELVTTNDTQTIAAISTAIPAVVQTVAAHGWVTGNTVLPGDLGVTGPLLQNRQFVITVIDPTHFSLQDAITGANIDGSTIGALATTATISRVFELITSYVGGLWSGIRAVQAETTDILLSGSIQPQALTVGTLPSVSADAVFAINPAVFNDGPYLDPFTNGVQVTPNGVSGIISLTLSFPSYSATKAYAKGSFVTSTSVNYVSLADQNVGNTPASSPLFWATTSAGAAIGPNGFQASDIGRLVRLLSEPAAWVAATVYSAGTVVSYNPSGIPGAATYWQSLLAANTGNVPGTDLTHWQIVPQGGAIWSWGKIVSLSNVLSPSLSGSVNIGNMISNGGVNAPFNGVFAQEPSASAVIATSGVFLPPNSAVGVSGFVGKNYAAASDQRIASCAIYAPTTSGFGIGSYDGYAFNIVVTLNLRGSTVSPGGNSAAGTLLGTTGQFLNTGNVQVIASNDQATAWKYVWVEIIVNSVVGGIFVNNWNLYAAIGQISYFSPTGTGTGTGVNVEILGPPLVYSQPIATWRLGAYSNTTGWPTCGTYHEGRLWLGGAVPNRFDASVSNGINGGTLNFAPTDIYGVVAASNAISYTLNSDSVNPLFWMQPDLQGIILGTQAGEWLVQAPTTGPISPTNIAARRVTKIGCSNVEPRRTEHTAVFVQRYGKKLMEYFADVYSGKFSAPNIADKAEHITRAGIVELAYQQAVTPIVWGRDSLGALFGVTYKRDTLTTAQGPTFNGWHRHALGSGRVVESLCVGPSTGGNLDTLTMVTNDPVTNIRHVELLTDTLDEQSPLTAAWFLDDSIAPASTVSSSVAITDAPYGGLTLNGLWHLNGQTVTVFAGGLDCGDFVVANGSIFISYGDGVSAGTANGLLTAAYIASFADGCPIVVGFTYNSDGQLVHPVAQADTGARNGPAFGKLSRGHRYAMKLVGTLGMSIGADFARKMFPANFKQQNGQALPPLTMFSGIHQDSLQDDYSYDSALCWRISRPFPANVVAIGPNIATQDQ